MAGPFPPDLDAIRKVASILGFDPDQQRIKSITISIACDSIVVADVRMFVERDSLEELVPFLEECDPKILVHSEPE